MTIDNRFRRIQRGLTALLAAAVISGCGGGGGGDSSSPPPPPPPPPPSQPTASFTAPASAAANAPVAFDASASTSPAGSALTYSWDFGNGNRGGGRMIAQLFSSGGPHSVTLTVVDAQGRSGTQTKAITITPPAAAPRMQTAQGQVRNLAGTALEGVTASVVGATATATSDISGKFNLSVGVDVPVTVRLSKAGFADQIVPLKLPITAGVDTYFEARMLAREAAQTLADAAAGGTVTGKEGAAIVLPANALVDAAGAAVAGPVQIALTPIDVTLPAAGGFPGSFDGVNANATMTPLLSFGATEFVLTRGGAPLQLAPGKTATIDLPVYADRVPAGTLLVAGDKLPLWSLDEETGVWINEGEGTLVASAASPTGFAMRATVSHLSWWNTDIGFDPTGPEPGCGPDPAIGIGAGSNFANATICNMLAEIDRGLGNASAANASSSSGRVRATAAAPPRFPGFARRAVVPVAGGVTMAVPANIDVKFSATALNGSWTGSAIVNRAVGERFPMTVLMRPLSGGTGTEAITLPFDGQRAALTGQTANYTFAGTASRWARITVTRVPGSNLDGTVRLLQGATALASANFSFGPAQMVQILPADGTYTIEVTGTANTPGGYRLQVDSLFGGIQQEALALPVDARRDIPAFTAFRGMIDVAARTAVFIGYQRWNTLASSVRVIAPDGSILASALASPTAPGIESITVVLPAAGRYVIEATSPTGGTFGFRVTAEQTVWLPVAPATNAVASSFDLVGLIADRNGAPVIVYVRPTVVNGESMYSVLMRRWDGAAWVVVADLPNYRACSFSNGFPIVGAAFDINNDPIVLYGDVDPGANQTVKLNLRRFTAGAWQSVGPDNGILPRRGAFNGNCAQAPVLKIAADNTPIVAYRADNDTVIQKLVGNQWVGLVDPAADVFTSINASFDLQLDPSGRVVFAQSGNLVTTVRRLRTSPAPAAWEPLGPNNGVLPLPASTREVTFPRIRFDGAGNPVIGTNATVFTSPSTFTGGTAVYRFDGTAWQSTGGYRISADSFFGQAAASMGFSLFEGEAIMSWVNTRAGANMLVAQRNTVAGWSAFGPGDGAIPQLYEHVLISTSGWTPRLVAIGGELYLAVIERVSGTDQKVQLMKYVK